MFFECVEDAVCFMCGKGGTLKETAKDGRETAFNTPAPDAPVVPVNCQAWLLTLPWLTTVEK